MASASSPEYAALATCPNRENTSTVDSATDFSSSTTRTRILLVTQLHVWHGQSHTPPFPGRRPRPCRRPRIPPSGCHHLRTFSYRWTKNVTGCDNPVLFFPLK